jgi:hypothetical protein
MALSLCAFTVQLAGEDPRQASPYPVLFSDCSFLGVEVEGPLPWSLPAVHKPQHLP